MRNPWDFASSGVPIFEEHDMNKTHCLSLKYEKGDLLHTLSSKRIMGILLCV